MALDEHLLTAFKKYKGVLKASSFRDTLKDDYISAKLSHKDGVVTTPIFDPSGSKVDPDVLSKGARVTALIKMRYIYFVSGSAGLTWDVQKVRLDQPGEADQEFLQ